MDWPHITLLTFSGAFLAVVAVNFLIVDLYTRARRRHEQLQEEQLRQRQRERAKRSSMMSDFGDIAAEVREEGQQHRGLRQRLANLKFFLEQSGLNITVSQLIIVSVGVAMLLGVVGWMQRQDWFVAVAAAAIGAAIPWTYVSYARRKRLEQLRQQLPDALDLMSRVMRSGQTISQAMQAVGEEFSQPISIEFMYAAEQMNLGLSQEAALHQLARRSGMLEMKIFVLAVLVHRQTGGNLAQLLDNLAHVVRERFRIQGMIRSLTAQGRLQAFILMCLPPAMFAVLMVISPTYEVLLLEYPSVIMGAIGMMTFGWLWIQKIVNFDF